MIWFYQRGDQHLYYEVRLRDDGPGYELGLCSPEGTLLTERFSNEEALSRRFLELQTALVREGWGPLDHQPIDSAFKARAVRRRAASCMSC
jgi:hypothetical protein